MSPKDIEIAVERSQNLLTETQKETKQFCPGCESRLVDGKCTTTWCKRAVKS